MNLPPRQALGVVASILAVALAWQFGKFQAGARGASAVPPMAAALSSAESRANTLEKERDTARATIAELRDSLVRVTRISDEDAAELELYRRIESGAGKGGLGIDSVVYGKTAEGGRSLEITLVQARGRDRISGTLAVSLLAGAEAGERHVLAAAQGEKTFGFDLRFFETIEVPLDTEAGAPDFTPERLEIVVTPRNGKQSELVEIRRWDSIVE